MNYGLYIHVPFCRRKCDYCGFYSVAADAGSDGSYPAIRRYVPALVNEIESRLEAAPGITVDTIYFGGGTPSLLYPDEISRIIETIGRHTVIAPGTEVSIEVNPHDLSRDYLECVRDAGVNRVTLGVQTINSRWHDILGRSGRVCSVDLLDMFFGISGFSHCLDIMTGIPGQTVDGFLEELDILVGYGPVHISAYLLSVEKNTALARRMTAGEEMENLQYDIYRAAMSRLVAAGYEHYEISNYCKPAFYSRHNMKYWRFEPYMGFGPGSHSFVGGERYCNETPLDDYVEKKNFTLKMDVRNRSDAMVEFIMTGLRMIRGFTFSMFQDYFHEEIPHVIVENLKKIEEKGMVAISREGEDARVCLTKDGIMMADAVIYEAVEDMLR
ncbi:MAG: hypothetical protein CVV44_03080 [Spirochaetae bacterium HGW-Spirochaetae-1]|jgi:oxygen-independent coproporphyrinogen-3 oxidase|nr:MAG: hypothetical protein CVV44_03080 [Spirochaetae bacterium HGW-Spirochaetae-1]